MNTELVISTTKTLMENIKWDKVATFADKNPREFAAMSIGAIAGASCVCVTCIKQYAPKIFQKELVNNAISEGKTVTIHPDGTLCIAS